MAAERKKLKESETTEQDSLIDQTFSKHLPEEIVSIILSKFLPSCSLSDYVRFPAIGKTWKKAFKDEKKDLEIISLPSHLPLLLFQVKDDKSVRNFYNPTNGKIYDFPLRGKPHNMCSRGSCYGWLLTVDNDELYSVRLFNPFRPIDDNEIRLPPLKSRALKSNDRGELWGCFYVAKAAFSVNPSSPSGNELVVMAITDKLELIFCRPGDSKWNDFKAYPGDFQDVVYYKGQFHAISMDDIIVCIDFSRNDYPTPKFSIVNVQSLKSFSRDMAGCHWYMRYLVECSGNLLRVRSGRQHIGGDEVEVLDNITRGFEVYKLVKRTSLEQTWVKMKSLNGCSLFLGGNASFSVLASNFPGCKPNHIYFTDDFKGYTDHPELGGLDLGVFNLEDGTFEAVPPGVEINDNNFSLYPIWVQLML